MSREDRRERAIATVLKSESEQQSDLHVWIPVSLHTKLKQIALNKNIRVSKLVRKWLTEKVESL